MKPEVGECYYHERIGHIIIIVLEKDDTILIIPITSGSSFKKNN